MKEATQAVSACWVVSSRDWILLMKSSLFEQVTATPSISFKNLQIIYVSVPIFQLVNLVKKTGFIVNKFLFHVFLFLSHSIHILRMHLNHISKTCYSFAWNPDITFSLHKGKLISKRLLPLSTIFILYTQWVNAAEQVRENYFSETVQDGFETEILCSRYEKKGHI